MFTKRRRHLEKQLFNAEETTGFRQTTKRSRILDPIDLPPSDTESIDEGGVAMRGITTTHSAPDLSIQHPMTAPREEHKSSGSVMTSRRSLMGHELVAKQTIVPPESFSMNHEPAVTTMVQEEEQDIDHDSIFSGVGRSISLAGGEGFSFASTYD